MSPLIQEVVEESPATSTTIYLSEIEAEVRRILLDVAEYIEQHPESLAKFASHVKLSDNLQREPIILRFTGGWVRDKLLGVASHDIDVAINRLTGEQFGLLLEEYMRIPGNAAKYDLKGVAESDQEDSQAGKTSKSKVIGGLHKIEANPERSKHLETVTTRILGLDIDLVNLRKESYSEDSRNPQIEFGSPEEDALRRDATANALFYNLHTQQIEDYTDKGFTDLQAKLLRTPLEPYMTFKDDPLRVLRLIRFASRLGWTIEAEALKAMEHPDIQDALQRKISRERVGIELDKALRGPDPKEALRLIFELNLYSTIFCNPTHLELQEKPDLAGWQTVLEVLSDILSSNDAFTSIAMKDSEEIFLAWQLATLVPYRNAELPQAQQGKKPPPPFQTQVAREGIKAPNKICELVTASVRHAQEMSSLVELFSQQKLRGRKSGQEDALARDVLGMKIRSWGPSWRSQLLYAMLVDTADHTAQAAGKCSCDSTRWHADNFQAIRSRYVGFLEYLQQHDLLEACELRPLLDGKALAQALNTKPGPWMKDALDVVMAWQLRNPGKTEASQAIEEVKMHGELAISLSKHFLELTIRPLFSKTKPSVITNTGRRAITERLPQRVTAEDESSTKPWKQASNRHCLDLLQWSLQALDEFGVEQLWPLLVPPILTLLDDWETSYKKTGAFMLQLLLERTPSDLLKRTGIGPVFEQALLPSLTYVPPSTTEQESLNLLPAVYTALISLARRQFPPLMINKDEREWKIVPPERIKLLDTAMRKGILYELARVSERPPIAIMLFGQLRLLLLELGVDAVKHLQYLLPMLNEILTHRLGRHHIGLLLAAVDCLQVILQTCRPRITYHRGQILKGLTLCWLNLAEDQAIESAKVRKGLQACAQNVRIIVEENGIDWSKESTALVATDHRLQQLLALLD